MKKVLLFGCLAAFQVNAGNVIKQKIENYHAPIEFDRMTECISDNTVYSVGMIIKKDGRRFICNKFKLKSDRHLDKKAPASWREKKQFN
ncbi:hypothetical protein BS333_16690 [Vibrio azureus]|uniref:Uncharacterized protein n=1 Tax=Vibrio azureus NBRC 104587 TaxID=1219077 RepID=U3CCP1_9VIBR|nr:hypothetical protein [Vibrio azureus]AUI88012.1 hypothetical protein BS333_16690 [Vibrio azureus]GAD76118.1 hypothetical protein VAZ01S_037_00010 [Vibrio azureus NBRC 104587]